MIEITVVIAAAAVSVLGAVLFLALAFRDFRPPLSDTDSPFSFLFNGDTLVHAAPGSADLVQHNENASDWSVLRGSVLARFPGFPLEPPKTAGEAIDINPFDPEDEGILRIQSFGEHARVELVKTSLEELALAPKGRLVVVGAALEPIPVPAFSLIGGQKSVSGSQVGSPAMLATMLDFCARHNIMPDVEYFPMSKVNEAIEHL